MWGPQKTIKVLSQFSVYVVLRLFGHQFYKVQKPISSLALRCCRIGPVFTLKKIKLNTLWCHVKGRVEATEARGQTIQLSLQHLANLLLKVQMDCLDQGWVTESEMSFVTVKVKGFAYMHTMAPEFTLINLFEIKSEQGSHAK